MSRIWLHLTTSIATLLSKHLLPGILTWDLICIPLSSYCHHSVMSHMKGLERSFQKHCPILSLFVSVSSMTSHLTETNPSPSMASYIPHDLFPLLLRLPSQQLFPLLAYSLHTELPWYSYCPKALPFTATSLTSAFPDISSSPSHISGPCLKVTSLKRSSMTTLSKAATPSKHSESLYFCLCHLSPPDILCVFTALPLLSFTRNRSIIKARILFCSLLYPMPRTVSGQ